VSRSAGEHGDARRIDRSDTPRGVVRCCARHVDQTRPEGRGRDPHRGANVSNDDRPADLVVTISHKDLEALGKRELDPMRAIMSGRMKLSNMALAMKLQPQILALFASSSSRT
jgi:hypothetical protein